ncbi:hypothetical protein VTK73DRAFT_3448 [Phialemonium thermophilum]|uniref:Zn(2)-C6 fungal-type domain-containing protein n=1 Tax=Phialemonium thermophilum TaxID=223376 RepID=A0ABR3WZ21_9PEZI
MPKRSLTLNACTTCRKKRTKCDGNLPCSRCKSRQEPCHYEDREWQTKEHLRSELRRLKQQNQDFQAVFEGLLTPKQSSIVESLRAGESVSSIAQSLNGLSTADELYPTPGGSNSDGAEADEADPTAETPKWTNADSDCQSHARRPPIAILPSSLSHPSPKGSSADPPPSHLHAMMPPSYQDLFPANVSEASLEASTLDWNLPIDFSTPVSGPSSVYASSPGESTFLHYRHDSLGGLGGYATEHATTRGWTMSQDPSFERHLIDLFFAWEVAPFSMVYKPLFIRDYSQNRHQHCSSALVAAISSHACRYLTDDDVVKHGATFSWGDRLFLESKSSVYAENKSDLSSLQTLGLLALREMCSGRESEAEVLVREGLKRAAVLDHDDPFGGDENDYGRARTTVLSGLSSLARMICIITDQLSPLLSSPYIGGQKDKRGTLHAQVSIIDTWVGQGIENFQDPSLSDDRESHCLVKFVVELTSLVSSILSHVDRGTQDLAVVYQNCSNCYASISDSLKGSTTPTPYVLFAHMYFHFCLIVLFRPFVKRRFRGAGISPRTVCAEAAQAIVALTHSYARLFSLRRTPCLLPYFVFAAGLSEIGLKSEPDTTGLSSTGSSFGWGGVGLEVGPNPSAALFGPVAGPLDTSLSGDKFVAPPNFILPWGDSAFPVQDCVSQAVLQLVEMGAGHPAASQAGSVLANLQSVRKRSWASASEADRWLGEKLP